MAVPVAQRISDRVFNRLQRLTVSGFNVDVSEVLRLPRNSDDFTIKHNQIVLTEELDISEELSHPGNPPATAWVLTFHVRCFVMPSEKDPTGLDELLHYFAADVRKVLTTDDQPWHTWGGLAINSTFQTPERISPSGGAGGVVVPMLVTFRTDEDDPYTVRG